MVRRSRPDDRITFDTSEATARRLTVGGLGGTGQTHHAAGTTEVHVAAGHEALGRCSGDHGEESHVTDTGPTNPNLMM